MKNINTILAVLLVILSATSYAQNNRTTISYKDFDPSIPVKGDLFLKNDDLDKFVGSYVWEENGVKMVINFNKVEETGPYDEGTMTIQVLKGAPILFNNGKKIARDLCLVGSMDISNSNIVTCQYMVNFHSSVFIEIVYIDSNTLVLRKGARSADFSDKEKNWLPYNSTFKKQI